MKTLVLVLALFVMSGCAHCKLERRNLEDLEATHALVDTEYAAYVEADTKLTDKDKAARKALMESARSIMEALKKAAK